VTNNKDFKNLTNFNKTTITTKLNVSIVSYHDEALLYILESIEIKFPFFH